MCLTMSFKKKLETAEDLEYNLEELQQIQMPNQMPARLSQHAVGDLTSS